MSFMPYVSPDQMMKDRSEYAHKGIARGRSVIGMEYADGLLFVAENPSSTLHKISEIYDRIAFAGVGKYSEFEDLRIAGIRHADLRGYSYGREDVKARDLANAYSQSLSTIFTQQMKPYEVEILVGEVDGDVSGTTLYHVLFDGSVTDEHGFIAIGGHAEDLTEALKQQYQEGWDLATAVKTGVMALGAPDSARSRRATRGRRPGPHPRASPEVPPPRRRRGQPDPGGELTVPSPASVGERLRLSTWSGGSSGSRTSTGSRARSADSGGSRPTRWPATCSDGSCTGAGPRTSSWRTAPACTWTSAPTPSTPRPNATTSASWSPTTRRGSGSWRRCSGAAEMRLHEEGISGQVYLFKNNTDSAGNSYGCHENYLVARHGEFARMADVLIPFFVTRQIYCGAGKVLHGPRGAQFCISQRAEHIWEGVSSATTRSRPIINTRDEPHADAERFRRLHVIVGDSNMSEWTTFMKVGITDLVLRMVEANTVMRDLTLENPIRAIREISHDTTCTRNVKLANGRELTAIEMQTEYYEKTARFLERRGTDEVSKTLLEEWRLALEALSEGDPERLGRKVDWVTKRLMIERYQAKHDLPLASPTVALLDLAYHDVNRNRGLYYLLEKAGQRRARLHRPRDQPRDARAPADHPREAARRFHPPGQSEATRLHG